jgi:branched-chain amino acid transport system substrate-binding protein
MTSRILTILTALLLASLGLAACGGNASGGGTLKIVSSLPMSGASRTQSQTIVNAEKLKLDQVNSQVCGGRYSLSYEARDDTSPVTEQWDPAVETSYANQSAADKSVIAYLGPFNSGAAVQSIPVFDNSGPLLMISPANTYPGLTKPGFAAGEPGIYYTAHVRNYARMVVADDIQGAVAARFVRNTLLANSVFILDDQEADGQGIAAVFEKTAQSIGLNVVGHDGINIRPILGYNPVKATDYSALMTKISTSDHGHPPDAIFAGMAVDSNAAQLLKDKFAILGDNTKVKFVGSDGIQTQAFIDGAGAGVADGAYAGVAGLPYDKLPPAGQQFKKDYDARYGGDLNEPFAIYGYEAMNALIAGIESVCDAGGDPTDRAAITQAVLATRNFKGALGTWSFDANGDTSLADITYYQVRGGKFVPIGQFK